MRRWDWLTKIIMDNGYTHGAEIGVKVGENLFHLLDNCPDLHMIGVDPFKANPDNPLGSRAGYCHWDHEEHRKIVMDRAANYPDRLRVITYESVDAAKRVEPQSLDFVFIDGDHSSKAVTQDVLAWRPKLKPGGLLCGHDADKDSVRAGLYNAGVDWSRSGIDGCWFA